METKRHLIAAAAVLTAAAAFAHIRLVNPGNGALLFWESPSNIGISIDSAGSDDISDGSDETALRIAIDAWNDVTQTSARLVENTSNGHLIQFDETNSSGWFPTGSGIVAITPIFFFSNGRISDADILFNGSGFQFTTDGTPGRFDITDVGAHELGHLLGLDHSGWAGATMYPYVDTTVTLHRSLSLDDARGLQASYPSGPTSRISGVVERSLDGSVVRGAHVVARDENGRTAGAKISLSNGTFRLQSLSPGTYTVYASPLDYPVSAANISSWYTVETDFESTILGTIAVGEGQTAALGTVQVGPDVALSLGRIADDYPLRVTSGATTVNLVVRGAGLTAGSTLAASDPAVSILTTAWGGTLVSFEATVPAAAAPGHVDLTVTNLAGDVSILTAGLEITPPDPVVTAVTPAGGSSCGTPVTVTGDYFHPGLRLVIGDRIYEDGVNCTVVDVNTITLTTEPTLAGLHDVVVIDSSGVEGRLQDAFQAALPELETVFPQTGDAAGGTTVVLSGCDFDESAIVSIDGVFQSNVSVDSSSQITIATEGGVPGGPYVISVENPGGATASSAFTYVSQPDPLLVNVTPGAGTVAGGQTVTVTGTGFTPGTEVVFGVDPATGAGGAQAQLVTYVDDQTLDVVTPTHGSGLTAVMVRESGTQQASVLGGGFNFLGASDTGGGGGCYVQPVTGPPTPRRILEGAGWILALVILLRAHSTRVPKPTRALV